MKTRYTVVLSMIAGAALGGAAIQGLYAQAKPPVYLVTEIDVTDPEAYAKEFAPKAQATIKAAGGRFIAIGGVAGVGAKPVTALQGTPPKRFTIQAWDSHDALKAWFHRFDFVIVIVALIGAAWWIRRHLKEMKNQTATEAER